jgi:hypothetical protein
LGKCEKDLALRSEAVYFFIHNEPELLLQFVVPGKAMSFRSSPFCFCGPYLGRTL